MSFDVISLFTPIPTDVAIAEAKVRLETDQQLTERTQLTTTDISTLLTFCLDTTEFQCKGKFYRQVHGTAMGSPVSVVVSNLVMESLENKALMTYPNPPRVYKRYVDDIACVINKADIVNFHKHLNSQDRNIQFTLERYPAEGLPFLDTLNTVNEDGSIDIAVYRKATHTDRYLNFDSHHPKQHKSSVVQTLLNRAESIPSKEQDKIKERQRVFRSLHEGNGYPKELIRSKLRRRKEKNQDKHEDKEYCGFAALPYVEGTTERIKRVLDDYNINTCVKPLCTLRQLLSKPKDNISLEKKTGVVYEIPCGDCEAVYIGETGRSLGTRQKEHQASVRLGKTETSALSKHVLSQDHEISWAGTRIVEVENCMTRRRWKEAWCIAKNENALCNRDSGRNLPANYLPLLKK